MAKKAKEEAPTYYTVKEFCENTNWSDATRKNYYYALLSYARFLFPDKDPNKKNPNAAINELNKRAASKQDPAKDISRYVNHMAGKPPKTVSLYVTAIRAFYGLNHHIFNKQEMKRIVPKTGEAETKQGLLTTKMLKKILSGTDTRSYVMVLLMASTGCRIGELCSVQLDDLDKTTDPWRICLRKEYTKNGRARYVFVTNECRVALETWLGSERMKYLSASYQRNAGLNAQFKDVDRLPPEQDHRLLGLSTAGFREIWYNLLKRTMTKDELIADVKTHVHPYSPHTIRKWFRTTLNTAINNGDICNLILGHWDHSLDAVYARVGQEGLAAAFKKGQYALSVESGELVKEIQEKVDLHSSLVTAQQREMEKIREELKNERVEKESLKKEMVQLQDFTQRLSQNITQILVSQSSVEEYESYQKSGALHISPPRTLPPIKISPKVIEETLKNAKKMAKK